MSSENLQRTKFQVWMMLIAVTLHCLMFCGLLRTVWGTDNAWQLALFVPVFVIFPLWFSTGEALTKDKQRMSMQGIRRLAHTLINPFSDVMIWLLLAVLWLFADRLETFDVFGIWGIAIAASAVWAILVYLFETVELMLYYRKMENEFGLQSDDKS